MKNKGPVTLPTIVVLSQKVWEAGIQTVVDGIE